MLKISGFKIGYKCPYCQYIRPQENMKDSATKWFEMNIWISEIKCPTCNGVTLFNEWEMVKYPCIKS
ncbi:hypothetical protein CLOHAE12215_01433 [Clostridium haemolyticum]|uniref:hypothetical protein n=1 Tax=Clostridium haemolyticum TaxID=84025 RepID=UPI001C3B93AB|nr:hypothetical protein [Clostridium haemolyticum]CAG7840017.1 hypothetical protein CLOHAE12215_01433 [Clostridium haemolyticum]